MEQQLLQIINTNFNLQAYEADVMKLLAEKINYLIERQLEQEEITRQNEESSLIEIDGMYYPKPERLLRNEDSNQKTSTNRSSVAHLFYN